MDNGSDLINLKTLLLKQVGTQSFSKVLRASIKTFLGEELMGFRILSSNGQLKSYIWDEDTSVYLHDLKSRTHLTHRMDFVPNDPKLSIDLDPSKRDELISVFYRSICYHYLLTNQTDELEKTNLTTREKEILKHILEGSSNRDIANHLGIRYRTVEKHCENIYKKLGVENRNSLSSYRNLFI